MLFLNHLRIGRTHADRQAGTATSHPGPARPRSERRDHLHAEPVRFEGIHCDEHGLRLGAMTRLHAIANDLQVKRLYPVVSESLLAATFPLRNLATVASNVLQRSRCSYFRGFDSGPCNKRVAGSGCAALEGKTRRHAVLGVSEQCISAYPGDLAQALIALEATVDLVGPAGERTIPFEALHCGPLHPDRETTLRPGEIITSFTIPAGPWTRRSTYLKVPDRDQQDLGLASAAVALQLEDDRVVAARIGLGGVAYRPWRAHAAETVLTGRMLDEQTAHAAARAAFAGAVTHGDNVFKPALGRHTLVRALMQAQAMRLA